jgi:hypothetical protein
MGGASMLWKSETQQLLVTFSQLLKLGLNIIAGCSSHCYLDLMV